MRYDFTKTSLILSLLATGCFGQDNAANPALTAPPPSVSAQTPKPTPKPMAEQPLSAFKELGASFALSARIGDLQWNEQQFDAFVAGMSDAYHHRHQPFDEGAKELYAAMAARVQELDRKKEEAQFQDPKFIEKFIRETRRSLNMQQTDSGLCYTVQGMGASSRPTPSDTVLISYEVMAPGSQTPFSQLAASHLRVKVSDLIPGLAEGVQMMTPGAKGVFILPPSLSYANGHWPDGVEKNSPLVYRVTLHDIVAPGEPSS